MSIRVTATRQWPVAAASAVLLLPLLVAVVALAGQRWFPVLDLAMTEFRVRDVGSAHTPLIGLPGRIGSGGRQGSHPGPLSFYLLAPIYRLFGSSAWALEVAATTLQAAAVVTALAIAYRRGGVRLMTAVAVLLALALRGFGASLLTQPWNPYMPLIPWIVVLLAAWAVLCGDRPMLLVLAIAGSFCAQTHVPYLGLCIGMAVLAVASTVWDAARAEAGSPVRRECARWGVISGGATILLWLPPVIDQLRHDPGNISLLSDYLRHPPEDPIGGSTGVRMLLSYLDAPRLLVRFFDASAPFFDGAGTPDGSRLRGLVVLAVWAGSVVVAWRMRHRALLRLHAVIAWALLLALVAMSRIFGKVWYYLTLWAFSVSLLLLLAVCWTVAVWLAQRGRDLKRALPPVLATIAIVVSVVFAVEAARVDPPEPSLSDVVADLAGPTAAALDAGDGAATGPDGRYIVAWADSVSIGSPGYGLLDELERRGFHVGVPQMFGVPSTLNRVMDPATATAAVVLATGIHVEEFRNMPDALEVAFRDPRDDAEFREFETLRAEVIDELEAAGLADVVPLIDENLFGAGIDDRVPLGTRPKLIRMEELGQPAAVFVLPALP